MKSSISLKSSNGIIQNSNFTQGTSNSYGQILSIDSKEFSLIGNTF